MSVGDRLRGLVPDRFESLVSGVRFGQFVSVGVIGFVCDTAMFVFLTEGLGILREVGLIVGIETAILVMFLVNDNWTFADERSDERDSLGRRLLRSHAVRIGGATTQFVVFVTIYRFLFVSLSISGIDLWSLFAKAVGVGIAMVVNYVFESIFTWEVHQGESH
ncbi:GtrA family protein [Haloarcula sp. S1CR25-12]|uniref:GtrA family protein n=1 Tax=Haloarcula saliterrae TaxID=2950534 RepID=A0ABU2F8S4_9EURY|nr:GtrA family protein [Haloarcula sp. S1CR25-12]MDS0258318.1 GtrA family protein [Haloarcula sp. S1CR25-12]